MASVLLHVATLEADDRALGRFAALLDDAELSHAARFRFARDSRRFVVRRARLRLILATHLGEKPEALAFTENAYGKPSLPDEALHFSLSHSGEDMLLALAPVAVGCDIERIDDALDWRPLADSLFTPGERAALAAMPAAAGRRGFFDCWSRKEAFVKALGLGLSYPLEAFDVSVGREASLLSGGAGWSIADLPPLERGYAGAVVARDDGLPLTIRYQADAGVRRNSDRVSTTTGRATSMVSAV